MTFPSFTTGEVLTAADMNAVGWWLITKQAVVGGANLQVDNVFSSTYVQYMCVFRYTSVTDNQEFRCAMRTTTDDTSANYLMGGTSATNGGVNAAISQNGATYWRLGQSGNFISHLVWFVNQPNQATRTSMSAQCVANGSAFMASYNLGGVLATGTQYTGFKVYVPTGNMTGSVRVYGYRE
jgi:hypothetical protein